MQKLIKIILVSLFVQSFSNASGVDHVLCGKLSKIKYKLDRIELKIKKPYKGTFGQNLRRFHKNKTNLTMMFFEKNTQENYRKAMLAKADIMAKLIHGDHICVNTIISHDLDIFVNSFVKELVSSGWSVDEAYRNLESVREKEGI